MGRPAAPIDPIHLRRLAEAHSDNEIAQLIGHARVTVTLARKRHGIPSFHQITGLKRRNGAAYLGGREKRILFNQRFFADLHDEAQAYFLGFLAADGTIERCRTELALSDPDQCILEDFIRVIDGVNCRVVRKEVKNRKPVYRLALCSKAMADDLVSWGLTPAKTQGMELKRPIPAALARHFMRGLWDGDGSIGVNHFEIGILSSSLTKQVARMITEIGGSRPTIQTKTTSTGKAFYVMATTSKRFCRFREELYRDSTLCLPRKREKFDRYWC